jgi:hypothetical protein
MSSMCQYVLAQLIACHQDNNQPGEGMCRIQLAARIPSKISTTRYSYNNSSLTHEHNLDHFGQWVWDSTTFISRSQCVSPIHSCST